MSGKLVVPSDITILEEKYSVGPRRVRLMEHIGLLGIAPMWHLRYSKNNKTEMKAILSRRYPKGSNDPVVIMLKDRQESVRKQAIAHSGLWAGTNTALLSTLWCLRAYDYKAKALMIPFTMYAGGILGRIAADLCMGRNYEYARNRFLGQLPAHQYYHGEEPAES